MKVKRFAKRCILLVLSFAIITVLPIVPALDTVSQKISRCLDCVQATKGSYEILTGKTPQYTVLETETTFKNGAETIPARLYTPDRVNHPPGVVLVHGIHRMGYNEPRVRAFARSVAGLGIQVLTPELKSLVECHIDSKTVVTIGSAVHFLRESMASHRRVGLMGACFGGGLSLLVAAHPVYQLDIAYVVCVGAHADLNRVVQFYISNQIVTIDGQKTPLKSNPYGPMVIMYEFAEDFFLPQDLLPAREALRLWLWGGFDEAQKYLENLSPAGRIKLKQIFDGQYELFSQELTTLAIKRHTELEAVSPGNQLKNVRVPVYLLHGLFDDVIPSTEALWIAKGLPSGTEYRLLITPAVHHVEPNSEASLEMKIELFLFLAVILDQIKTAQ